MKCVICKKGETAPGFTTVTLVRDASTIVFKQVPAEICSTCGEVYIDGEVSRRLLQDAEIAASAGIQVEVRSFAA